MKIMRIKRMKMMMTMVVVIMGVILAMSVMLSLTWLAPRARPQPCLKVELTSQ